MTADGRKRSTRDRSPKAASGKQKAAVAGAIGAVALGAVAAAAIAAGKSGKPRPHDSAPGRTARKGRFGDYHVVGRTVTINRPRAELFAYWRDFQNLPRFMENVEAVQPTGPKSAEWTIAGPAGKKVRIETKIAEERKDEFIAWRSLEGSDIDTEGRVAFRDAPGGRGTEVEAIIAYKAPGGAVGRGIAKLLQREPGLQARRELRRFKMLMETGEIATSLNRKSEASA